MGFFHWILLLGLGLRHSEGIAAAGDISCLYTVQEGESLVGIFQHFGFGVPGARYRLYQRDSYLAKTFKQNRSIEDWYHLMPGQQLTLVLPPELEQRCRELTLATEKPTPPPTSIPIPEIAPPSPITEPEGEELPSPTPPPELEPEATIEETLPPPPPPEPEPGTTPTPESKLKHKRTEKVAPLFRAMYGISLAPEEYLLLTKMSYFSAVYQFKSDWNWHLSLDVLPPARDVYGELVFRASSYRLSGGPILVLPWRIKIIPKVHYWSFDGDLPLDYEEYLNVLTVSMRYVGVGLRAEWDQPISQKLIFSLWGDSALDGKIQQKNQSTGVLGIAGARLGYQLTRQWNAGLFGNFQENRFFHGEVTTLGKRLRNPLSDQPNHVGESASSAYRLFYAGIFVGAMW